MDKNRNKTRKTNKPDPDSLLQRALIDPPFSVPEKFFEEQRKQILEKTIRSDQSRHDSASRVVRLKPVIVWTGVAAAAVVLLFFAVFQDRELPTEDYFTGITLEQVLDEKPGVVYWTDEETFYDALSFSYWGWEPDNLPVDLYLDSATSDESILDYLIDEEVSIEMLNL